MSSPDYYDSYDFVESIDGVAEQSIDRLLGFLEGSTNLSEGDYCVEEVSSTKQLKAEFDLGDDYGLVEFDVGFDRRTDLTLFTCAFNEINPIMLQDAVPTRYFCDVINGLIMCGIKKSESNAGNIVTQLLPDREALEQHLFSVWSIYREERQTGNHFSVYNFAIKGEIFTIQFRYDEASQTWSLGYLFKKQRGIITPDTYNGTYDEVDSDGMIHSDTPRKLLPIITAFNRNVV